MVTSEPGTSPRASMTRRAAASASFNQAAGRFVIPASDSTCWKRRRSRSPIAFVHAACRTGASSTGTTKSVLRMPSMRRSDRCSYSSRSIVATAGRRIRAHRVRNTVLGSLECSATRSLATWTGELARVEAATWCRRARRARRSTMEMRTRAAMTGSIPWNGATGSVRPCGGAGGTGATVGPERTRTPRGAARPSAPPARNRRPA